MVQQATLIGKKIGSYVIEKTLGRGGMGSVYLAQHTGLDKKVAIKILSRALVESSEHIKRFFQEARTAAKLEHPQIVQVFDVGEAEDLYYIVMQYVEGKNLDQVVEARGKLTVPEAVTVIRKCAAALGFAHKHGVIHRDVKPANILVGPKGVVKVADFGLSKSLNSNVSLSQTGDVMGTPYFMSPEQAKGEKLDFRTDIYSLGTTFYFLLTGQKVFEGETPVSIALKHVTDNPRHVRELDPSIPEPVAKIAMKMMAKNRDERYQNMDEVLQALQSLAVSTEAKTVPVSGPAAASRRKWPWFVAAGVAALLLVVVMAKALGKKDRPVPEQAQKPPVKEQPVPVPKDKPPDPPPQNPPPPEPHHPPRVVMMQKLKERSADFCDALIGKDPTKVLAFIHPDVRDLVGPAVLKQWIRKRILEIEKGEYTVTSARVIKIDLNLIPNKARVEFKMEYRNDQNGIPSDHTPLTQWSFKDGEWYLTGKKPD